MPLPAGLVVAIAFLALAAPASAADPVSGVLDAVAKTATPAVAEVVSAPAPVAPTPAAAQQAGDRAPGAVPIDRPVEHETGSLTTSTVNEVRSELPATTSHHDPTQAGPPAHQPESAPRSEEAPHPSGATPSHAIHSGASAGATTSIVAPQHPSDRAGAVAHGAVLAVIQVAPTVSGPTGRLPADQPLPPRLPAVAAPAVPAYPGPPDTVQRLVLAPGLLAEYQALGEVGETATRVVETLPLLGTLPSLPTLPPSEQPPTPAFTLAPWPVPSSLPIAPSSPAGPVLGGGEAPSTGTALQGAWLASSVVRAYVTTANGIRGVKAAPDRPAAASPAVGALRRPAGWSNWAAGTTASAYGLSMSDGTAPAPPDTTSPGDAYEQPSPAPAPAPGSASPATGAVAGTSIPIFLTLAGLLLLAAPRARRVLRLLGESWGLSPLALILERPG